MPSRMSVALLLCLCSSPALAQYPRPEPAQNPSVAYRLFNTKNIYTFVKLDTRDGRLWQVQWGDRDSRFTEIINAVALVPGGAVGRFTLYPTENIYTFLLLDQQTGDAWHVQWGKPEDRFIVPIE